MILFELTKDFNENGIVLKKGEYTKNELIKIYESEDKFNFCFQCTSLKDILVEKKNEIETPEDKLEVEIPVIEVETPEDSLEIETPEDKLEVETKNSKKNRRNK